MGNSYFLISTCFVTFYADDSILYVNIGCAPNQNSLRLKYAFGDL